MSEYEEKRERSRVEAEEALRREWGDSFPAKLAAAQAAFQSLTGEKSDATSVIRLSSERMLGDQPELVRMFAAIGEMPDTAPLTPDAASRELYRLESEEPTRSMLLDSMHPGHAVVMSLRSALHRAKSASG